MTAELEEHLELGRVVVQQDVAQPNFFDVLGPFDGELAGHVARVLALKL